MSKNIRSEHEAVIAALNKAHKGSDDHFECNDFFSIDEDCLLQLNLGKIFNDGFDNVMLSHIYEEAAKGVNNISLETEIQDSSICCESMMLIKCLIAESIIQKLINLTSHVDIIPEVKAKLLEKNICGERHMEDMSNKEMIFDYLFQC